jgi:PII-like signaling protein
MSIKSKLVKALCALTALSIVACASITGFAASFTTTTVYDIASEAVNVETTVTGVDPAEQVTYLVHDATETIEENNIIYINQDAADTEGSKTFNFSTTKTRVAGVNTTVKVGSESTTIDPPANPADSTIDGNTISVSITGGGTLSIADGTLIGNRQVIEFTATPAEGYELVSVSIDDVPQAIIGETYSITGNGLDRTISVEFEGQTGESTIADLVDPQSGFNAENPANSFITTFGTVSILPEDENIAEYGILFAVGAKGESEMIYGAEGVTTYLAVKGYGNDGKFAVKLVDGGSNIITDQTYTTRPFLKIGDDVKYGSVRVIEVEVIEVD